MTGSGWPGRRRRSADRAAALPPLPGRTGRPAPVTLGRGERELARQSLVDPGPAGAAAGSTEAASDGPVGWLIATTWALIGATETELAWRRGWHLIDGGSWDDERRRLTVTWMDGAGTEVFEPAEASAFLAVFRERVQASIVIGRDVEVAGRTIGRAVLRKDLETGRIVEQVRWRPGATATATGTPEAARALAQALAMLRDDIGG